VDTFFFVSVFCTTKTTMLVAIRWPFSNEKGE